MSHIILGTNTTHQITLHDRDIRKTRYIIAQDIVYNNSKHKTNVTQLNQYVTLNTDPQEIDLTPTQEAQKIN